MGKDETEERKTKTEILLDKYLELKLKSGLSDEAFKKMFLGEEPTDETKIKIDMIEAISFMKRNIKREEIITKFLTKLHVCLECGTKKHWNSICENCGYSLTDENSRLDVELFKPRLNRLIKECGLSREQAYNLLVSEFKKHVSNSLFWNDQ